MPGATRSLWCRERTAQESARLASGLMSKRVWLCWSPARLECSSWSPCWSLVAMLVAPWLRAWARRMAKTTCVRLLRGGLLSTSLAVPLIRHLRMSRRFHRGFLVWSLGGLGSCSPGRQLARLRSRNATEIDVSEVYFRSDVVSCLNTPVFRIGLRALCFRLDPSL